VGEMVGSAEGVVVGSAVGAEEGCGDGKLVGSGVGMVHTMLTSGAVLHSPAGTSPTPATCHGARTLSGANAESNACSHPALCECHARTALLRIQRLLPEP
jgi:hypothetical protein